MTNMHRSCDTALALTLIKKALLQLRLVEL